VLEVFDCLWAARLKLKLSKCALLQQVVRCLAHVGSRDGMATDPERDWIVPRDLYEWDR